MKNIKLEKNIELKDCKDNHWYLIIDNPDNLVCFDCKRNQTEEQLYYHPNYYYSNGKGTLITTPVIGCRHCLTYYWKDFVPERKKTIRELKEFAECVEIRFGKHKGLKLKDVPKDYLKWLTKQDWLNKELHNHIINLLY